MRKTSERARTKTTGGGRQGPPATGRGGAAPVEAQRNRDVRPPRVEKVQLERWENEGGATGAPAGTGKAH